MIHPIVAYGDPILRKVAQPIDLKRTELDLKTLTDDMFETMYASAGVGLAAPQIGLGIRLFVVDGTPLQAEDEASEDFDPSLVQFRKIFVNAEILEEDGDEWAYEEGCLSIPGIRADVYRPEVVTLRYQDLDGTEHTASFEGMAARIIQHEYDHLDGVLFTDHLTPIKKQLLKKRLGNIAKGDVKVDYQMKFVK